MTDRKKEEMTLRKVAKLVQQHIFEALTLSALIGIRFRFYFKDDKNNLKILGAQIVSWQFQKGKLYLDTSSPSIRYLVVDKKGVKMVGNSDMEFLGRIEVH